MAGMNMNTGKAIDGIEHLRQSIARILTTPQFSRLMRRDFGSLIPELIDQPANPTTFVRLYAATAGALIKWEPRFRVSRVQVSSADQPGRLQIDIEGYYVRDGLANSLSLRVPLQNMASA
ncbi:GPW/gp25 family protein [Aquabacterium sp.]|uniref:GPW/gp25 family protein n=1 Tax=Aquabacterium sp. TaxID=1872578 RepID=UPI002627E815|nr:GPW/gp25 family protein [Aquabacterium sp.]MDD2977906.1 GPW/gp25 family protein [Aquabacterium sp.]